MGRMQAGFNMIIWSDIAWQAWALALDWITPGFWDLFWACASTLVLCWLIGTFCIRMAEDEGQVSGGRASGKSPAGPRRVTPNRVARADRASAASPANPANKAVAPPERLPSAARAARSRRPEYFPTARRPGFPKGAIPKRRETESCQTGTKVGSWL